MADEWDLRQEVQKQVAPGSFLEEFVTLDITDRTLLAHWVQNLGLSLSRPCLGNMGKQECVEPHNYA